MDSGLFAQLVLPICMLAAFVATSAIVLVFTTSYETPAMRLQRYARITGRASSPGAAAETLSFRERLLVPFFRSLVEMAARTAPSRARKTVAAELIMAGSRMNPTMFLGLRTIVMFGMPVLGLLYVISNG